MGKEYQVVQYSNIFHSGTQNMVWAQSQGYCTVLLVNRVIHKGVRFMAWCRAQNKKQLRFPCLRMVGLRLANTCIKGCTLRLVNHHLALCVQFVQSFHCFVKFLSVKLWKHYIISNWSPRTRRWTWIRKRWEWDISPSPNGTATNINDNMSVQTRRLRELLRSYRRAPEAGSSNIMVR
jgi:hypothetical protein